MEKELFICDCCKTEHMIMFNYDKGENYKFVYAHIHLTKRSFFGRLKYAFKYIFGYKCRYGAFEELVISKDNYAPFENVVKFLK